MGEDFSRIWRRVFLAFCRALFAGPLQNRRLREAVGSFCERVASGSHEEAFVDGRLWTPAGNVNARGTAPGPPSPSASPSWPFKVKKYGTYVNREEVFNRCGMTTGGIVVAYL